MFFFLLQRLKENNVLCNNAKIFIYHQLGVCKNKPYEDSVHHHCKDFGKFHRRYKSVKHCIQTHLSMECAQYMKYAPR